MTRSDLSPPRAETTERRANASSCTVHVAKGGKAEGDADPGAGGNGQVDSEVAGSVQSPPDGEEGRGIHASFTGALWGRFWEMGIRRRPSADCHGNASAY